MVAFGTSYTRWPCRFIIEVRRLISEARLEVLPLPADGFEFSPVVHFCPQVFLGHLREFPIPALPPAPIRRMTIVPVQEPFGL
jgi:hypothetical protein